jgi:hypothetical protein
MSTVLASVEMRLAKYNDLGHLSASIVTVLKRWDEHALIDAVEFGLSTQSIVYRLRDNRSGYD